MKVIKALKLTLIVAVAGIVSTFLVFYIQRSIFRSYEYHQPYLAINSGLKNEVAGAYAKTQKFLTGVEVDFDKEIVGPLSTVMQALQDLYDGRQSQSAVVRTDDEDLKALIKEASIQGEKLMTSLNDLKASVQPTGDSILMTLRGERAVKAEASYNEFQLALDGIGTYVAREANESTSFLSAVSWASIAAVFITFTFLVIFFYNLQKKTERIVSGNTTKLEAESKRVRTLSQFIEAVSAGNFDIELNEQTDDNLTTMLVGMRDKLKNNAEEDRKRNWATTGLAQIGEILRNTNNSAELYDDIIRFTVKYTKSNQGGLFIVEDEEGKSKSLDLVACYAFERKKYLTKKIQPGDGLVGQCFLEGQRVYLLEVPDEYISITSGLGGATPRALLIVPLKVNGATFGVLELASFNPYENHEIELVEKLAESIASTISSVRVNETTRQLLERTQQQTEEMKSQEEEIRQNMEELEATQEEMRRKQDILEKELDQSQKHAEAMRIQEKKLTESQETLQAIVDHLPRAIFWKDTELRFMGCNKIFAEVAGASSPKELIGKTDFDMSWKDHADAYRKDDLDVMRTRKAKLDIEEVNINSEGEETWVLTSKVPIINEQNEAVAILGMFEDITARKRKEADINKKLEEREHALKELKALKQLMESRKA